MYWPIHTKTISRVDVFVYYLFFFHVTAACLGVPPRCIRVGSQRLRCSTFFFRKRSKGVRVAFSSKIESSLTQFSSKVRIRTFVYVEKIGEIRSLNDDLI
eukprot:gb/GEZJ01008902.1/.p1 GENE.gb/GEZJ01008902.1/~~gb/GEZJ01008902.1/.p1  ORF type:complete len:100 (+),score=1.65 gb/GEZJ01008902.1/:11-310(+)